jgi:formamidopyrimidine-DNA glycosylase
MIDILRYMPELPEVETIARRLKQILPGKTIKSVNVHTIKSFVGSSSALHGLELTDVSRRAKIIRFHLPNNTNLLTHLKMTGQLIYVDEQQRVGGGHPTADFVKELPSAHTRITYGFDDDSKLFFNDQRMFGWMRVMGDDEVAALYSLLGPDINDDRADMNYLFTKLKNRSIPIKQAMMMNEIVAGVGNIYACDALNIAQISPFRPAKSFSRDELNRLLTATKKVIEEGIRLGGTTFDGMYVNVEGLTGTYQEGMRVYGRSGEKCYQCGGIIVKSKLGGRGTYYCSVCQRD